MEKLVKCKACGREIAKGAKVCPGCGKKQKKAGWKVLGILILGIGLIIAIGDGVGKGSSSSGDKGKTYKVGESVKTDNLEITIIKVEKLSSIVGTLDAPEGAVFVAVAYKYKNISDEAINGLLSGVDIKLVSPEGTEYDSDTAASIGYSAEVGGNEKVVSDLNPGITVKGGTVFEVAKEKLKDKGWKLNVDGIDVEISL